MTLTKEQKIKVVDELAKHLQDAKSVVFSAYQGLSVKNMEALRKLLRKEGGAYHVARKTLIKIAARKAGLPEIPEELLPGAVGIAVGFEDEIAPAKVVHTFGKQHEMVKLLGGVMEGKVVSLKDIQQLATLPGKDELRAKLVYVLNSPIAGFHGVLHGLLRNFACVVSEIKKKKETEMPASAVPSAA